MVKISDCSCECRDKGKEQQIEERALSSINKILGTEGQAYYPDGTGAVTIPIADADDLKNAQEVPQLKISVQENTGHLETVDNVLDVHARSIKQNSDDIAGLDTLTDALTKELPTEFVLYRPGSGKIQLQYQTEDGGAKDSNVLDMIIPTSYDIIPGSTARSFKLKITWSNGTEGETNDFLIPEGGGTDVTVTGVTLVKITDNSFKTQINLSDGTPLQSGTLTTVNSVAGSFADNKLIITVNGVSSLAIPIDATGTTYKQGAGIKIASGTISVDDTVVALKSDITDMETKTNANNTFATKTALAELQRGVGDAFKDVDFDTNTGVMTFTAIDEQQNALTLSTELVWTKMADSDLTSPTIWHVGDQIVGGMWVFALSGSNPSIKQLEQMSMVCTSADATDATFEGSAFLHNLSVTDGQLLRTVTISADGVTGRSIDNISVSLGAPVASGTPSGSKPGYKSTQARITGGKTASTIASCADLVAKAKIGDSIIAPTVEVTQATITDTPIHIVTTSDNIQAGSTIYINCLEMTVISRTDEMIIASGYGRYSFTTSSGSKSETTIQQIRIRSDGSVDVLVAGTWTMSKTSGNVSKFSMLLIA